jgi:two-component system sensor histidine kinase UhpB
MTSTKTASDNPLQFHDGIRAVLDGQVPAFSMEYPCHTPDRLRWFNMTVTPFRAGRKKAVVVHTNITDLKIAERELIDANGRQRALSSRLITIQEEERQHIARELHDEIGQALSALKMALHGIGTRVDTMSQGKISIALDIIDSSIVQVRKMSLDLRPPQLDDLGLSAAIRWNMERQCGLAGLAAHFVSDDLPSQLPESIAISCYRISQEAITNIVKHARARNVWIELSRRQDHLHLGVRDDGNGLGQTAIQCGIGPNMGVASMRQRARMVDGQFDIEARPGVGTTVRATFPLAASGAQAAMATQPPER